MKASREHERLARRITAFIFAAFIACFVVAQMPSPAFASTAAVASATTSSKATSRKKAKAAVGPYLTVHAENKEDGACYATVKITGKTTKGKKVNKEVKLKLGKKTNLKLGPGTYKVTFDSDCIADEGNVYSAGSATIRYKKKSKKNHALEIPVDVEATQKRADEKAAAEQAAAEKAAAEEAQRQAEEQARREQEAQAQAQAQAEAEAQARAQAEAQAQAQQNERTVYITRTGNKYHKDGCRYLRQSKIAISLSDAQAQGYTACSICGG